MIEIPQKIVCVGLNYRDHAAEQGVDLLQRPLLFAKWPNTLIANGEPIRIRDVTTQVDYEAELGVVISRTAKDVALEEALGFVQGYVVANDVSARDPVRRRSVGARQVARQFPTHRRRRTRH